MDALLSNLASGLLGTIIGGVITFFVARYQINKEDDRQTIRQEKLIRSFLEATQTEVSVAWNQYSERIGSVLESLPDGEPFLFKFPIYSDYFSVYHANGVLVVQISNADVRQKLIKLYTLAKGHLDSFQYNNKAVELLEALEAQVEITNNPVLRAKVETLRSDLTDYAGKLKFSNLEISHQIKLLQTAIEGALKSSTPISC